jgi:hypothetical protein
MNGPVKLRMGAMEMDGAAPGDRARLEAAVQRELRRLIARGGAGDGSPSGPAGPVRVAPGTPVHAVAAKIARSVYARMGGGG